METVTKITGCQGLWAWMGREMNSLSTKDFQGSERILSDTVMMDSLVTQR